jgi:2,4-dienoyl-CoA reductase-like NADH-dependent reductase (Old Yellow Enzyme family)
MHDGQIIFSRFRLNGLELKNRITMAPLFLGYANPDGTASPPLLDHYREMASSGASMIVVENAAVHISGLGSPFVLRADDDRFISGMGDIAKVIKNEGAVAFLQINHAGRYAYTTERMAPSPLQTWEVVPREMREEEIHEMVEAYASAARRVKDAGFDGVEVHGGTGYLLVQFLSSRTNWRKDHFGGSLENRMRFPLMVVDAVRQAVGEDYPVGYRFLADEWLPGGLHPEETTLLATELKKRGVAYLSVMAGTYDSFFLPEYLEQEKHQGYMAHFAAAIKQAVPGTPIIAAGRIQTPETANRILEEGVADLIGLARVLFADPLWVKKASGIIGDRIIPCEETCSLCTKRVMRGKPAFCSRWEKERREAFRARFNDAGDLEE